MKDRALTDAERERLAFLIEEAAEVQRIAAKVLRHGWFTTDDNTGTKYNNQVLLEKELGDMKVAVNLLTRTGDLSPSAIETSAVGKAKVINSYLHHNRFEPYWVMK